MGYFRIMSKRCKSCGEPIPIQIENKLGVTPNICLNCLQAAVNELHMEDARKYYGLEGEIDV